jgi:hypothetical protein
MWFALLYTVLWQSGSAAVLHLTRARVHLDAVAYNVPVPRQELFGEFAEESMPV